MFDKVKAFKNKLKIWKNHLLSNNTIYFPYLRKETPLDTRKYAQKIQNLIANLNRDLKYLDWKNRS